MKFLIAVVALLAIVGTIESYSVVHKARSLTKRSADLVNKIKDKKIKEAVDDLELDDQFYDEFKEFCPDQEQQLKDEVNTLKKCVDKIDDDITVCEAIETTLTNCTKSVVKVLDDCLPLGSKGLPDMLLKSIIAVQKHSCSVSGETNLELINPCFYKDLEDSSEEDDAFEEKLTTSVTQFKKYVPRIEDICGFLAAVEEGIQDHLKANCKNPKTKTAFTGFYEAIAGPCKAWTKKIEENNTE